MGSDVAAYPARRTFDPAVAAVLVACEIDRHSGSPIVNRMTGQREAAATSAVFDHAIGVKYHRLLLKCGRHLSRRSHIPAMPAEGAPL